MADALTGEEWWIWAAVAAAVLVLSLAAVLVWGCSRRSRQGSRPRRKSEEALYSNAIMAAHLQGGKGASAPKQTSTRRVSAALLPKLSRRCSAESSERSQAEASTRKTSGGPPKLSKRGSSELSEASGAVQSPRLDARQRSLLAIEL